MTRRFNQEILGDGSVFGVCPLSSHLSPYPGMNVI